MELWRTQRTEVWVRVFRESEEYTKGSDNQRKHLRQTEEERKRVASGRDMFSRAVVHVRLCREKAIMGGSTADHGAREYVGMLSSMGRPQTRQVTVLFFRFCVCLHVCVLTPHVCRCPV